jgi:tetratricopeptide (TPR) repeat protein
MGDMAKAEATSRREVAAMLAALGDDHPDVADARGTLTAVLLERGKLDEALEHSTAEIEVLRRWSPEHPTLGLALARRGKLVGKLGRHREAIAQIQEATRLWPQTPQADPWRAEADLELARLHEALGEYDTARRFALQARDRAEAMGRPGDRMPADAEALAQACARKLEEPSDSPATDASAILGG